MSRSPSVGHPLLGQPPRPSTRRASRRRPAHLPGVHCTGGEALCQSEGLEMSRSATSRHQRGPRRRQRPPPRPCSRRAAGKASQSRTVASPDPEASVSPSGLNASEKTSQVWPGSRTSSSPVATSQIRMLRSWLPEAIRVPSGWKTAAGKPDLLPCRRHTCPGCIWASMGEPGHLWGNLGIYGGTWPPVGRVSQRGLRVHGPRVRDVCRPPVQVGWTPAVISPRPSLNGAACADTLWTSTPSCTASPRSRCRGSLGFRTPMTG